MSTANWGNQGVHHFTPSVHCMSKAGDFRINGNGANKMNSRERVIAAIEFKGPDRIPHRHAWLPSAFAAHERLPELYACFPSDFAGEDGQAPGALPIEYCVGTYTDEWQCLWTVMQQGAIGQVTGHPLANPDAFGGYTLPPAEDARGWDVARKTAANRGSRYLLLGWMTLFERMADLCGHENLLMELALGNPAMLQIRDRVVDHTIEVVRGLLALDPDGIYFADDWGTQTGLQISPSLWREFFLPAYRRQFAPVREAGKHVFFHTDGYTIEILPDLVEAGVNVFWADLTINPLDRLHRELGGKVCFQGLTDVQFILRNGTPEQVREHARELMTALGCFDGGFIACSEIGPDQPWENIEAVLTVFNGQNI